MYTANSYRFWTSKKPVNNSEKKFPGLCEEEIWWECEICYGISSIISPFVLIPQRKVACLCRTNAKMDILSNYNNLIHDLFPADWKKTNSRRSKALSFLILFFLVTKILVKNLLMFTDKFTYKLCTSNFLLKLKTWC